MCFASELKRIVRFGVVGGTNTALTTVALIVLARYIDPRLAYAAVYTTGLAFTTIATGRWVFEDRLNHLKTAAFLTWYIIVFIVGLAVISTLTGSTSWSTTSIALIVIGLTAPLNYLGGRRIFRGKAQ